MSISRSANCSNYHDRISVVVTGKAVVPGDEERCTVELPATFSCQTTKFERADDVTSKGLRDAAQQEFETRGCDVSKMQLSLNTNLVGATKTDYSAKELVDTGMASNCFAYHNDVNDATHTVDATCYNMYDMKDAKGNTVRDYHMKFRANLQTCNVGEDAMPQLEEDVRKVAQYNAGKNGYKIAKPEHLACNLSIMPNM